MNLANPGVGDVLDRLTILARKAVETNGRKEFQTEFAELCEKHRDALELVSFVRGLDLAALNAAIWQREDKIRDLKAAGAFGTYTAQIAYEIQDLNDRRAALIAEINGTPGEKLYFVQASEREEEKPDPAPERQNICAKCGARFDRTVWTCPLCKSSELFT